MRITKNLSDLQIQLGAFGRIIKRACSVFLVFVLTVPPSFAASLSERFDAWLVGDDTVGESYGAMGDVSAKCMTCHDGTAGPAIVLKDADAPMQYRGFKNVNHPVGMEYDRYVARRPDQFAPPRSLPAVIVLENGRVGCISCHVLREGSLEHESGGGERQVDSKPPCMATASLTVGPTETDLCFACHQL